MEKKDKLELFFPTRQIRLLAAVDFLPLLSTLTSSFSLRTFETPFQKNRK